MDVISRICLEVLNDLETLFQIVCNNTKNSDRRICWRRKVRWIMSKSDCWGIQCKLEFVSNVSKIFKDTDMTCVPKKYENLKTHFLFGNQHVGGPDADYLIVSDCGCTTYFHCHWLKKNKKYIGISYIVFHKAYVNHTNFSSKCNRNKKYVKTYAKNGLWLNFKRNLPVQRSA